MTETDILELAIDRADAIFTYWNILLAVATALLGTMASGKKFTQSVILKGVLTLVFSVFAVSNLLVILQLASLRVELLSLLGSSNTISDALISSLAPAAKANYIAFHLFIDMSVVAAVWFVPWYRE